MKIFKGTVISKKMAKTATVEVETVVVHPVYKKRFRRKKRYHVGDDFNVNVGDVVEFIACRPISKLKRWKIIAKPTLTDKKPELKSSSKSKVTKTRKEKSSSASNSRTKETKK